MIYAIAYDISLTRYDIHLRCIDVSLTRRSIEKCKISQSRTCVILRSKATKDHSASTKAFARAESDRHKRINAEHCIR